MGSETLRHNRLAWDRQVEGGNVWTVPVGRESVAEARQGRWEILLTPTKPVPRDWFPELVNLDVLCLASGGGQQGPILAAAGARVTVFDNSPRQLAQDRMVAEREGLEITTVEGDMADLGCFADESFGLVVHPVSNVFVPEVRPVWAEAYRVLRPGGVLLAGVTSPVRYLFDEAEVEAEGMLRVVYTIPYSDLELLSAEERRERLTQGEPLEFGHSLEDQIGGQLEAGFVLTGFYEDVFDPEWDLVSRHIATFLATRAAKL